MVRILAPLAALSLVGCSSSEGEPPAPSAIVSEVAPSASAPPEPRPLLVQLTRDFCLPCQEMKPSFAQLRRETADTIDIALVNVDRPNHRPFAVHFAATNVPTQIYVDATGAVVARHEGLASLDELRAQLTKLGWARP